MQTSRPRRFQFLASERSTCAVSVAEEAGRRGGRALRGDSAGCRVARRQPDCADQLHVRSRAHGLGRADLPHHDARRERGGTTVHRGGRLHLVQVVRVLVRGHGELDRPRYDSDLEHVQLGSHRCVGSASHPPQRQILPLRSPEQHLRRDAHRSRRFQQPHRPVPGRHRPSARHQRLLRRDGRHRSHGLHRR